MDTIVSDIFMNKKYYMSIVSSFIMAKKAYAENKKYYFLYEDKNLGKSVMYNSKQIVDLIYLPYFIESDLENSSL